MTAQTSRFQAPYGPDGTIPPGGPKTGAEYGAPGGGHSPADEYRAAASAGATAQDADRAAGNGTTGPAALGRIGREVEAIREYASLYVAARADAIKLTAKRSLLWAALGLTALLALAACIVTATSLLVIGISRALAAATDGPMWLAQITTGAGLLIVIGAAMLVGLKVLLGKSRARTVRKYNERRQKVESQRGPQVEIPGGNL